MWTPTRAPGAAENLVGRSMRSAARIASKGTTNRRRPPATTLYRHVGLLVSGKVLAVVEERRIRGTIERTYALGAGASDNGSGGIGHDELRAAFTVFVAGLAGDLDRYLERDEIDPAKDGVGFRQAAFWLSDSELADFTTAYGQLLVRFAGNQPTSGRTRRVLSTIFMPDEGAQ